MMQKAMVHVNLTLGPGQIKIFLVNALPPKLLDIEALNSAGA